jgi:Flp pilus assembly protein TadG
MMSALNPANRAPQRRLRMARPGAHLRAFAGFGRREDGSLLLLGLVLLVLMAMLGGLAVDLMRHEQRRTEIQQTLDRSVLAAAAVNQQLNSGAVVNDYFNKAGLAGQLSSVNFDRQLNYRWVEASARSHVPPFFIQMLGINGITAAGESRAEQRISNVEVSLVLDVSGSMSGSRINNLRPAAREFVTSVLGTSDPGRVSISIIPYNAQVNIGRPLMSKFNVTPVQDRSSCIELPDWAFNSVDLSTTTSLRHNAHFDPYGTRSGASRLRTNCSANSEANPVVISPNQAVILSDSVVALHGSIDGLIADGNTSIDIGVKWGAYLLNNSAVPVVNALITDSVVEEKFRDRPLNGNTADVLKVLVVMTDGQNTTEYKISDPYHTGPSNIWRRASNGRISVYVDRPYTQNDWYWPRDETWNSSRDGGNSESVRQSWPEVWNEYSVQYVAEHFYVPTRGGSKSGWENNFMDYVSSNKNTRLQAICTAAKQSGIVVYGIGFEAPSNGRTQMRRCATTDSHYFNAQGLTISTAFRAIANNITQLRLTQ